MKNYQFQPGDQFVRYDAENQIYVFKRDGKLLKRDVHEGEHLTLLLSDAVSKLCLDIERWTAVATSVAERTQDTEILELLVAKGAESDELVMRLADRIFTQSK